MTLIPIAWPKLWPMRKSIDETLPAMPIRALDRARLQLAWRMSQIEIAYIDIDGKGLIWLEGYDPHAV